MELYRRAIKKMLKQQRHGGHLIHWASSS